MTNDEIRMTNGVGLLVMRHWSFVLRHWCFPYEGSLRASEVRFAARLGVPRLQASRANGRDRDISALLMPDEASRWAAGGDEAGGGWRGGASGGEVECAERAPAKIGRSPGVNIECGF